jgi:hypothetical protein
MINYLRQNYPEDFNDYIESSEYLALIDMIAFLGQNLSFRVDLNARENFLETAERRESVLRLARMLSYNPRRNQAANGLLKFDTIKTTENILDSNGLNLSGITVKWNDQTNSNYFEQFVKILNSALPVSNSIGNPLKSATIADVQTQKYRLNATNTGTAIYPFTKRIEGISTRFEVVSTDISTDDILEEAPLPGNSPAFLFRDDGQGAGSSNTGFFMHFRQGKLETGNFSVSNPTPNQAVQIDAENINDTDVWLFSLNSAGYENNEWTRIDSTEGNNVIYNSLFNQTRDVFAVTTRIGDRINLVFSDGVFGNLPAGNFRAYYRTSNNVRSVITPSAINTVSIEIPYQSRNGSQHTLTIGLKLTYTVSNGTPTETNTEIKQNAPATYYTQNRLITGEDYNIGPLAISQDIIKTKSSNRISSGISRFFDLKDASGKYSNTSLFADDGVIYKEEFTEKQTFTFATQTDIEGVIYNTIEGILSSVNAQNFYLAKYPKIIVSDLNASWNPYTTNTNQSLGLFQDVDGNAYSVGSFTANSLRLVEAGTLLKFVAPDGYHFMPNGTLMLDSAGTDNHLGKTTYKWCRVISVQGDGTTVDEDGIAPIVLNDIIPEGSILEQVIPNFSKVLINDVKTQLIDQVFEYKDFALRYDQYDRQWKIVLAEDINTVNDFAIGKAGDITGENLDASWMLYFKTDGEKYTIAPYSSREEGQIFYLIDEGIFRKLNKALNNTEINTDYKAYFGRAELKFHYVHVADSGYRIDPSASNIIDTYILSKNYDTRVKQYIAGTLSTKPKPPSNDELFRSYGNEINKIKSISDEIIYHPVKYKILFGDKAAPDLQVRFKIVKNPSMVINDNELKSDIIEAINKFFDIENWDFGETFYFQELSAYIINELSPKLVSILIVPRQTTQSFGSLFEIKSEPDEIFASAAKVTDIETIDQITATNLQASGNVITSVTTSITSGITSSASTSSTTTGGGYSY